MWAMDKHPDSKLIDELGGPTQIAKVFGISSQAVSSWRRSGIPRPNRMYLELKHPAVFSGGQQPVQPPATDASTASPPGEQLLQAEASRDDTGLPLVDPSTEPEASHV